METIFVLLPLALLIAAIAVGLFLWAARTGQFDDLETPAVRILFDDDQPRRPHGPTLAHAAEGLPTSLPPWQTTPDPTRRVSE